MDKEKLRDQIWTTRISRVNAEKRLCNKEAFFQGINIYYSLMTIFYSIILLTYENPRLNLITVFMSIALLVSILYLNTQKYMQQARDYHNNYIQLQKLEFEIMEVEENDKRRLKEIQYQYCELLNTVSNHISYDYYTTVAGSRGEYRKGRYTSEVKALFWWSRIGRAIVKMLVVLLPFILLIILSLFN